MSLPDYLYSEEVRQSKRDFQRAIEKEKWYDGPLGQITKVDNEFYKYEEAFISERERLNEPLYDLFMLHVCRNSLAGELLLKTDNENVRSFILQRAKQPISLPELPPEPKTSLDILIDEILMQRTD